MRGVKALRRASLCTPCMGGTSSKLWEIRLGYTGLFHTLATTLIAWVRLRSLISRNIFVFLSRKVKCILFLLTLGKFSFSLGKYSCSERVGSEPLHYCCCLDRYVDAHLNCTRSDFSDFWNGPVAQRLRHLKA